MTQTCQENLIYRDKYGNDCNFYRTYPELCSESIYSANEQGQTAQMVCCACSTLTTNVPIGLGSKNVSHYEIIEKWDPYHVNEVWASYRDRVLTEKVSGDSSEIPCGLGDSSEIPCGLGDSSEDFSGDSSEIPCGLGDSSEDFSGDSSEIPCGLGDSSEDFSGDSSEIPCGLGDSSEDFSGDSVKKIDKFVDIIVMPIAVFIILCIVGFIAICIIIKYIYDFFKKTTISGHSNRFG